MDQRSNCSWRSTASSQAVVGAKSSSQATEALPVLVEITPQLADPSLRETELRAHVLCAFAGHEVFHKAAIAFAACLQPSRESRA